ncbi:MAG: GGDEF domain-containing protein [Bacilli bacterium]|nr:GGDEF domain-containing protein [Bacilli bacterium]
MSETDQLISRILEKLEKVEDKELVLLVKKLIDERNYLSEIANIDTLTGLNNRRILERIRECSGVVMCDIDDFKKVNDTYGHDIGDTVIKRVTEIIKENTRSKDYVCRFGGDEFFIGFVECPENIIDERIEKIRREVSNDRLLTKLKDKVTISFGFVINYNLEDLDSLIKKADKALYESKKNGRNKITKYEQIKIKKKKFD